MKEIIMTTNRNSQNNDKNQSQQKNNLSDAANKMRTSDNPEERSEAAKTMGHAGGQNSHRNTNRRDED